MVQHVPTVTTLGSCRISGPMRAAAKEGLVTAAGENVYGFVHSVPEALQLARFITGRLTLPLELGPYLSANGTLPAWREASPSDWYLIEISSLKEIRYGGYFLQSNYLQERLQKLGGLNRIMKANFRIDQRDRRAVCLAATDAFARVSPEERRILVEAHLTMTTRDEMERAMVELAMVLPSRVAFVTHCNVPSPSGQSLEARRTIIEWAAEIGAQHGLVVIDPSSYAMEYGVEHALDAGGHDLNHYTPEFERRIGIAFAEVLHASKERTAGAAGRANRPEIGPIIRNAMRSNNVLSRLRLQP